MPKNLLFVLLADDDEDDRLIFKEAFEQLKIQTRVEFVSDGIELMDYLNNTEELQPDILFLDLNMPKKSGHACVDEIKKNDNLKNLIIAIYSTSSSEEDIEKAFIKGAHIYIKKPKDFDSLKKIVGDVMSINWQYHTTSLDRDNFMIRVK